MLWIHDMAIPDPYYVLPLIMGVTMFVQQKLSPAPPDPVQAKVMMALPILFTFMFLWFPAGLVLYWVVNNTLSIAQQWVITQRVEAAAKSPGAARAKASEGPGLAERARQWAEQGRKLVDLARKSLPDSSTNRRKK